MENTKLLQGDCLELMKNIPDGSVDLTVTSPPYDNLRTYNGNIDQWNFDKFKDIAKELYRVTANGGVVVWIVADATIKGSETGTSFRQALHFMDCGFNLHDTMIWEKPTFTATGSLRVRYAPVFEYMFVFSNGKPKTFNPIKDKQNVSAGRKIHGTIRQKDGSTKKQSCIGNEIQEFGQRHNVWKISPERNNKTSHPAVFPEQLAKDHIISWSNEGDVVLDCFMGSGTTGKMAVLNNRNFIGIELDKGYFDIAEKRINKVKEQPVKIIDKLLF
jgi:site-specific DNA-methyltransferase (adenine-specific)